MRGTIIMWNGEKGALSAGGQRYDFDINHWQGTVAPAANMTVDVTAADGKLGSVTPVNDADLAKEKLAAMTGKGGAVARAVFAHVGMDVAIAYGVFLIAALFFSVISSGGFISINVTLADLLSGDPFAMLGEGSGRGVFLVLLATATIAVPYFWKHRFAPLAFLVPLLVTLIGFKPIWDQYRQQQQAIEAMGEFARAFGQAAEQMSGGGGGVLDSLGFGAYVVLASAIYLAYKGVMKSLASS